MHEKIDLETSVFVIFTVTIPFELHKFLKIIIKI